MTDSETFEQFDASIEKNGVESGLRFLEQRFRESKEFHRLFDVLKMKSRRELGLSLLHQVDDPPLNQETQTKLESHVLEACREIAKLHFAAGDLNDGWIYLQPLSDELFAKELVEGIEVTQDNFQAVIEIAFSHGVAPAFGYRLLLENSGTCDGITAFDMQTMQFDRATITELASILLNHFYQELQANVVKQLQDAESKVVPSTTLSEMLKEHDWLVTDGGHHADPTHLASVVRIARQTTTKDDWELAIALTNYGSRLDEDFQFAGDPPFEQTYQDHRIWFEALALGQTNAAIDHFKQKAESAKGQPHELAAAEALIDLLILTDQRDEAVDSTVDRILPNLDPEELPAAAFEIANSGAQYQKLSEAFRKQNNFVGYAFAVLCRQEQNVC